MLEELLLIFNLDFPLFNFFSHTELYSLGTLGMFSFCLIPKSFTSYI